MEFGKSHGVGENLENIFVDTKFTRFFGAYMHAFSWSKSITVKSHFLKPDIQNSTNSTS